MSLIQLVLAVICACGRGYAQGQGNNLDQYRNCKHSNTASWLAIGSPVTMQRWKSLRYTEAWRIYAIALLNVLLSSSNLVRACEELDPEECGLMIAPTNKTSESLLVTIEFSSLLSNH